MTPYTHVPERTGPTAVRSRLLDFRLRLPTDKLGKENTGEFFLSVELEKFDAAGARLPGTTTFELRGADVTTALSKLVTLADSTRTAIERVVYEQAAVKGKAPVGGMVT